MISRSSDRHSFQLECHIKECKENKIEPDIDVIKFWEDVKAKDIEKENNVQWQKNNLEYDLRSTLWILEKVRNSKIYAQNLYAALCNNDFVKNETWPILQDDVWACSWRHAGGIIADMRQEGDYINWYCSGIRDDYLSEERDRPYVAESIVTDEIKSDLLKLGWLVKLYED